jgi:epoxyqueuosine reductase
MSYMAKHGTRRTRPDELVPGTVRVLSARMNYWPGDAHDAADALADRSWATSRGYAVGRDYHKLLRKALQGTGRRHRSTRRAHGLPVFRRLGASAREGAGAQRRPWVDRQAHQPHRARCRFVFFIGEILTDLPLPVDESASAHCGTCSACIPACPTGAITAPYQLDARRCIST